MNQNDMVMRARYFVTAAHGAVNQKRKYTGEDYIVHPIEVAEILAKLAFSPIALQAALLHDVLEDTNVSPSTLMTCFGKEVFDLVIELTKVTKPEDGNRETRMKIELDRLAKASDLAQSIKVADLISNSRSIVKHDKEFAKVYIAEKEALLDVLTRANKELLIQARAIIAEAREELAKS